MGELYPMIFRPVFMERVWGGRRLAELYNKPLPCGVPVGESWEIVDREEVTSVIENGRFKGKTLRWLMENFRDELLGITRPGNGRFPLLIKILDAQDVLSVQVHPPEDVAEELGGEPKKELWYVAHADLDSVIYAGLKHGVTEQDFLKHLSSGSLERCLHRLHVKAGDAIFVPAGRIHALGKGPIIFEIQQNSDTTYRIYDWNRTGLDGKPRTLHIQEALRSINFSDFEPQLIASSYSRNPTISVRFLVDDELFRVNACRIKRGVQFKLSCDGVNIIGMLKGVLGIGGDENYLELLPGQFCMIPSSAKKTDIRAIKQVEFLQIEAF